MPKYKLRPCAWVEVAKAPGRRPRLFFSFVCNMLSITCNRVLILNPMHARLYRVPVGSSVLTCIFVFAVDCMHRWYTNNGIHKCQRQQREQLDVKGCKDIHESFAKYVEEEMLDGENK